ncbi:chromodomain-helicase-DNA-binding protein 8 isoform X3 [Ambystoma mexicanum]|uniref:chromodomain-helicase-DNA-binding protein 8 isoform X3 n=1 Tax=Ambystoma mexicanum TaxID=8296 RepID=UPI0037E937BB
MADPIMDLFDDPNLFGLDSLTEDAFDHDGPDTMDDALGLTTSLTQLTSESGNLLTTSSTPETDLVTPAVQPTEVQTVNTAPTGAPETLLLHDYTSVPANLQPAQPVQQSTKDQGLLSQGNPFMGVNAVSGTGQQAPKIVILKAPPGISVSGTPVGQLQAITQQQPMVARAPNGGKVTYAKVLTGTPLRAGMSIVSGNTVLATKVGGQATMQRLVQPNRPVKQLVLQPIKSQPAQGNLAASGATVLKPGITLNSSPAQGESKRITLVLQQPPQGGQSGPRHVMLGGMPGKILLQSNQLAALTQAKNAQGHPAKVVTIQLQMQHPQNSSQQPQKYQLVQQGSSQTVMIAPSGQQGQRQAVPLKVVLHPQSATSQGSSPGLSVVKVLTASEVAALAASATSGKVGGTGETRKLEHQKKQEKANRIVAEAIARARARGEQNIPRVLNEDELPVVLGDGEEGGLGDKKRRKRASGIRVGRGEKNKEEKPKKAKSLGSSKSRAKCKTNTITPIVGKKRKRNFSSDNSDGEQADMQSGAPQEDDDENSIQKRRSNRHVKRRKYTEDLDFKITDDEEEEDVDVMGLVKMEPVVVPEGLPPLTEPSESVPSMQFFVENPSEEDAAIVDKILSMRVVKKELPNGMYMEAEEFFVKYKNYSYLHCEWATIEQLEKDKRIHQKLKRFKAKMAQMRLYFNEDEEPFNPDYVEVDRILEESHSIDKDNGEAVIYYLVKWCSLPYEDSTWELKEDVDETKVLEFKRIQSRMPDIKRVVRPPATAWKKLEHSREYQNGNELRDYQLEGVNWLLFNWYNRQNCILADEMGLGKTIQSITFLEEVYSAGLRGPFLVIAPLSTITNWEREFATWTNMNTIVYHGSLASRQMIQQYEMYCKDSKDRLIPGAYKFDALITTFEMVLSDCPELREIEWRCVIIDEAHRLKNRNCKLLDSLKHMDLEHKVLLTGTPLQNTVEELFSLLHFLEPSQFPSESEFLKDFGDLKTEEQVQKLQAILKPMMLRRLKEDVEKNLAPKQETIIEVELTNMQKKYYRAILEKNFSFLSKGANHANTPNLLNTMMELRKCCNHPYLITGAEEKILAEFRDSCHSISHDFHLQAMVRSSGKLVLIDKLLPKLKAGGHKVLIFSQMVRCLDILEDYLIQRRYLYERIDGRVRGNLRQAAIDRFSKPDSDRFVFLLCTRAGGLGINLTAADTCIIFDSDWNPQNDLQAQARCHRIGQSKAVKVYRLVTRNSYEREMFDKASLKLGLDKAVLQSMSGRECHLTGQIQQFTKKEIEDLLRKGAYAAIMDEDDEGSKFCEEDIDQILQRRATTITIESEGKGSTFAKASFVASENRTDIALDDPNFWQKWAKKADLDMESLNSKETLVIDTPRVRKQTRHFSNLKDDDMVSFSDLESEDDEMRPRPRRHDRHHGYGRTDCFRVEKHLLVYGWGRWKDILSHGRFKRRMSERDVEIICRTILVYCLLHYRGDEAIKSFIWDLISPVENGQSKELQNHTGLSIPVPRGRKGKKMKSQNNFDVHKADWIRKYNPDSVFQDEGYKKHLKHQCNKVLLRVRMLYYLRQEVIGDQALRVLGGTDSRAVDIWFPEVDQLEVPTSWWDTEADKSLLLGVFKHGYEKYNTMRADPALCFLEKVGRPDEKAIAAEHRVLDNFSDLVEGGDFEKDCEDPEYRPLHLQRDQDDEGELMMLDEEISVVDGEEVQAPLPGRLCWPPGSALTARLRRLITAYQRSFKREQAKMEAAERGDRRRRRCEAAFKLKEIARREKQQSRWTRREESEFYRVVSSFGVEYDPDTQQFSWDRFRSFARLDKKTDASLVKYFLGFVAMCRQVCRLPPVAGDESTDHTLFIEPITEERASRTLYRVELLRRLREQVLCHPLLQERLALCQPGPELPEWWECGRHDGELLRGAAWHGVSRADYSIMQDPELSFLTARLSYIQSRPPPSRCSTPLLHQPYSSHNASRDASPLTLTHEARQDGSAEEIRQHALESLSVKLEAEVAAEAAAAAAAESVTLVQGFVGPGNSSRQGGSQVSILKMSAADGDDSDSDLDLSKMSASSSSSPIRSSDDSDEEKIKAFSTQAAATLYESVPHPILYDEESLLSLNMSQDGFPITGGEQSAPDSLQERHRISEWPKDRVLINRIDLISQAVLTGKWPNPHRIPEPNVNIAACETSTSEHIDTPSSITCSIQIENEAAAQFTKLRRGINEKEFTVQMKDDEGLKMTFQKQRMLANGGLSKGHNLFRKKKGIKKRMAEVQQVKEPQLQQPWIDVEARIPVVNKQGKMLLGDDAPRRCELDAWLQGHPEFSVDPRFLAYMEDRRKQKRHRVKKSKKISHSSFSGVERAQPTHHRNGKKGYLPDTMFDRLHPGPKARVEGKKRSKRPRHDMAKMVAMMQREGSKVSGSNTESGTTGRLLMGPERASLHGFQQRGLMPVAVVSRKPDHQHHSGGSSSGLPFMQYGGASGESEHMDSDSIALLHPTDLGSLTYHQPHHPHHNPAGELQRRTLEAEDVEVEGEVDDLSQGYDSSERDFSLIDDPMMPANSDSSDDVD